MAKILLQYSNVPTANFSAVYYTLRLLTIVETKNQIGLCQMFWK
jgi:hypothetical protein